MDIYTDGSYIKGTASGAAVWLNDSGVSVRTKVNKVFINNSSEYCELLSIKLAIEVAVDNKAKSICIFNDHIGARKKINGILSNKIINLVLSHFKWVNPLLNQGGVGEGYSPS